MPPQQLLLSWKDHNGALVSVFENLLKGNTLVDCTLAAEGQYLKAHKIVLSACSSYFELLFSQENEKNPIVILKDVKFQELEAAVNFMYRGEVEVCEDRLTAFLEVANSLQIKGLGSDGETQDFRPSSPSLKGSKTAVPPKSHSREEVSFSQSWNTGDGCITIDSDKNSNERSSHFHLPHRETSCSSPISSTFATTSSYSLASASTSGPVVTESVSGGVKVKNNQCSSPSVSLLPPGDTVPSDVNTVVKSEPVTDMYLDEKSNEAERDCDMKMEDQEDWEDPNLEYMGDDQASNQQDPGFSLTEMKTEESISAPAEHISSEDGVWVQDRCGNDGGNTPAPQFASTFFQEHQPSPSPSFGLVSEPTSSITSVHQGGVPAGSAQRGKTTMASRSGRYQCHDCSYSTSSSWSCFRGICTAQENENEDDDARQPLPVPRVRLLHFHSIFVGQTPPRPHGREALQVHGLCVRFNAAKQFKNAHAYTHRGETFQVHGLYLRYFASRPLKKAHAYTYQGDTAMNAMFNTDGVDCIRNICCAIMKTVL